MKHSASAGGDKSTILEVKVGYQDLLLVACSALIQCQLEWVVHYA